MTALIPFRFQHINLKEACWIGKTPYFTRRAIGEFLEYPRPQKAIDKIVERNSYLRDIKWAVTVNLTATDHKQYEMEVYNPIGLQLIIMESHQPKARQFKIAVAHLVWAYMNGQLRHIPPNPDIKTLAELPPGTPGKSKAIRQHALDKRISTRTVRRLIKQFLIGETSSKSQGNKGVQFVQKKHAHKFQPVTDLYFKDKPVTEIVKQTGVNLRTVYRWIKKAQTGLHIFDSNRCAGGVQ